MKAAGAVESVPKRQHRAVVPGLTELADSLASAGYTGAGLRALLGVDTDLRTTPADLVVHERRLAAAGGPLADVVSLFALGWPCVERRDTRCGRIGRARGVDRVELRGRAGRPAAPSRADRAARPTVVGLRPARRRGVRPGPLHVTGINPPATLLAALTVRRPVARALDVGTGNGVQALLAAQHCERVVATDVNQRALAFAAFNAALNGVANVEFRTGSLFEPVAGERFDLIVSNPPYVISPEHDFVYRDSGAAPGALCAELIGALPEDLDPGGFASVLASWPVTRSVGIGSAQLARYGQSGVADAGAHRRSVAARTAMEPAGGRRRRPRRVRG